MPVLDGRNAIVEARNAIIDWGVNVHVGPKSYAPLIVPSVMLFFAWVTIALRLYTRTYLIYAFGWDDVFMIIALCCFTIYSAANINITSIDQLLDHMPWPDLVSAAKSLFLALVFYVATVTFLKISLGVFLLRIINTKGQRMLIYAVMTVSTVWGLVAIFVAIFQCGYPYSAGYFLLRRFAGTCISGPTAIGIAYTHAVVSAGTDVVLVTLPLFILRDAHINKRAKWVLGSILVIGGIGSVASLVRFVYVRDLGYVDTQFLFKLGHLSIWSTLECGLGISAGSLATLRPMFRKFLQATKQLTTNKSRNSAWPATSAKVPAPESKTRSLAARLSRSHRSMQHSARRLSDHDHDHRISVSPRDPEVTGQWGFAMPMTSISEKPAHGAMHFERERTREVGDDLDMDDDDDFYPESFVGISAMPPKPAPTVPPLPHGTSAASNWPIRDGGQSTEPFNPLGSHAVTASTSSADDPSLLAPERPGVPRQDSWV